MKIQVLVATMCQNDHSLLERLNLQSDAVVVNQCNSDGKTLLKYKGYDILWIDSTERGLSRSRNMALKNADGEICILCDDDEKMTEGYPELINKAFCTLKKADIVVFNIKRVGCCEQRYSSSEKIFKVPERVGYLKTYGSVHISFRRRKIVDNKIGFNENFGTGSGLYSNAEDAIFCMECHRKKLGMYTYPGIIGEVVFGTSTWFTGYNEKYFYDVGAYLSVVFPKLKHLMKWYYPIHFRRLSSLSTLQIIKHINYGFKGYKKRKSYEGYMGGK